MWVLGVVGWLVAGTLLGFGNTVGYHRLLTHRAFRTRSWIRAILVLLGAMHSGSPLAWVAIHRLHHARSDGDGDPHSPRHGFWHAHCGWLIGLRTPLVAIPFALSGFGQQLVVFFHDVQRLLGARPPIWLEITPDLREDPLLRVLDAPFVISLLFAAQVGAAWLVGGWWGIVWLWALHVALTNGSWAVNSIGHHPSLGRADQENPDDSRNVPWLAWLTFGEGWHNHHHRFPRSARHGLGEPFDPSWWLILGLARVGLADEVWLPRAHREGVPAAVLAQRRKH